MKWEERFQYFPFQNINLSPAQALEKCILVMFYTLAYISNPYWTLLNYESCSSTNRFFIYKPIIKKSESSVSNLVKHGHTDIYWLTHIDTHGQTERRTDTDTHIPTDACNGLTQPRTHTPTHSHTHTLTHPHTHTPTHTDKEREKDAKTPPENSHPRGVPFTPSYCNFTLITTSRNLLWNYVFNIVLDTYRITTGKPMQNSLIKY